MMNNLMVVQSGQFYRIYTPQGIEVAEIFMGCDGQIAQDVIALAPITKAIAKRWGIPPKTKNA